MKTKIQVAFALLVIVGAVYWAFNTARSYTYVGNNIMFPVGGGHAIVKNTSNAPIPIEMRSGERIASFRVTSADLGMTQSSKRQGTGRDAFHAVYFDLPPGQARIDITSGSGVQMISRGETRIEATVVPVSATSVRWVLILSGGVSLWALYYMSSAINHSWVGALRGKKATGSLQPPQSTS